MPILFLVAMVLLAVALIRGAVLQIDELLHTLGEAGRSDESDALFIVVPLCAALVLGVRFIFKRWLAQTEIDGAIERQRVEAERNFARERSAPLD